MPSTQPTNSTSGFPFRAILGVFKLRIGVVITFTALAGLAVGPGPSLSPLQLLVLTLSVLVSSGAILASFVIHTAGVRFLRYGSSRCYNRPC